MIVEYKYEQFAPDLQEINSTMTVAKNVLPSGDGFVPAHSFTRASPVKDELKKTTHISYGFNINGISRMFAMGDKIYSVANDFTLTDVSRSSKYTGDKWESLEFNGFMIASNGDDNIQYVDLSDVNKKFQDVASITAKTIAVVKDFVVAGNIYDSDGTSHYKMRWSGFLDPKDWKPSASTQSGFQIMPKGGSIVKIVGGEFGIVFMQNAIYRMTYVGGKLIFQFDLIEDNRGCKISQSVVRSGKKTYFYSDDGLYATNGQESVNIGANRINDWFEEAYDNGHQMYAITVPKTNYVYWSYKKTSGQRTVLVYDESINKFSYLEFDHDVIGVGVLPVPSIDSMTGNLDTDYISPFDSIKSEDRELFMLNAGAFHVIDTKNYLDGEITSGLIDVKGEDQKTVRRLMSISPIATTPNDMKCQTEYRIFLTDPKKKSILNKININGKIPQQAVGRFFKVSLFTEGDFGKIIGFEYDIVGGARR